MSNPLLVVLSGPSGVGKDAVLSRMKALGKPYHFTITATTRPRRAGERDGSDYIFVSPQTFQRMIENDELLEWARVYGHYYGVPKSQVMDALSKGQDVIIKADVQGAATIKRLVPEAVAIFLAPPSMEELAHRLRERMTESRDDLELRLKTAQCEMQTQPSFDYVVINYRDRLDDAAREICRIVERERQRVPARHVSL